jgi:hypothetical protein
MKDPEHKDISDPTFNAADFRLQVTGGRLRWFASVLALASAGLFVYLLAQGDKAGIDFPVIITGQAALWIVGIAFIIWVAIAVVNWKNWFRKKKNNV